MEQQIRFCSAPDGVRIAYATFGNGPPLVKAANWLSHLEFDWRIAALIPNARFVPLDGRNRMPQKGDPCLGVADCGGSPVHRHAPKYGRERGHIDRRDKTAGRACRAIQREREVAGLIADGLTNREIGERLFITERTAESHVQHILDKLQFSSRSQIAAWAVEHGLHKPSAV